MKIRNEAFIQKLNIDYKIPLVVIEDILNKTKNNLSEFGVLLIKEGYIKRNDIGNLIGNYFNVAYVELNKINVNNLSLKLASQNIAEELCFVPINEFGNTITIALNDPSDEEKKKQIAYIMNKSCSFVFSFGDEIKKQLSLFFKSLDTLDGTKYDNSLKIFSDTEFMSQEKIDKLLEDGELINILNALIYYAIRERASDIHIEPYKNLIIRFRVDGKLRHVMNLPIQMHDAILNRLKILSNLDITEKRMPLDGGFTFQLNEGAVDIRLSTLPAIYGEKAVLRILAHDSEFDKPNILEIGITKRILDDILIAVKKSNGMLFVTGPTGAGKTTTLYALIEHMKNPELNIVTIEDPVEYNVNGIIQISVNMDIGRDFSTILRGVLRQDPDVILVGEIRDLETARIAATAALTGHTVLTTLHTNNAIQAITRMTDMGVQNFVVAPSIIGVLNQRLVRMICPNCRQSYVPDNNELSLFQITDKTQLPTFYRGKGCENCHYSGYKGRIPIMEYIKISKRLRSCILQNSSHEVLAKVAREDGYKDLRYDGLIKVLQGLTTLEEVMRVTSNADMD